MRAIIPFFYKNQQSGSLTAVREGPLRPLAAGKDATEFGIDNEQGAITSRPAAKSRSAK